MPGSEQGDVGQLRRVQLLQERHLRHVHPVEGEGREPHAPQEEIHDLYRGPIRFGLMMMDLSASGTKGVFTYIFPIY